MRAEDGPGSPRSPPKMDVLEPPPPPMMHDDDGPQGMPLDVHRSSRAPGERGQVQAMPGVRGQPRPMADLQPGFALAPPEGRVASLMEELERLEARPPVRSVSPPPAHRRPCSTALPMQPPCSPRAGGVLRLRRGARAQAPAGQLRSDREVVEEHLGAGALGLGLDPGAGWPPAAMVRGAR